MPTAPDMANAGDEELEIRDKYSEAVADTAARHSCEIDAKLATQVLHAMWPQAYLPMPPHRCNPTRFTGFSCLHCCCVANYLQTLQWLEWEPANRHFFTFL